MSDEGIIDGKEYRYPHCNSDVLHAPGACYYCDHYPDRQRVRAAGGTPFTPKESNGWSGNVAVTAGQVHSHMGMPYVVGGTSGWKFSEGQEALDDFHAAMGLRCDRPSRGFYCKLGRGHDGPCPAYARLWKKLQLYVRQGVWWP